MSKVKATKKATVHVETKVGIIDKFGEIMEELRRLEKEKEELRKRILDVYGEGEHIGDRYVVSVSKRRSPILNIVKVYKKLGIKKFLKVISINLTQLKKFLTLSEIEEMVEDYRETYVVSAKLKK